VTVVSHAFFIIQKKEKINIKSEKEKKRKRKIISIPASHNNIPVVSTGLSTKQLTKKLRPSILFYSSPAKPYRTSARKEKVTIS